MVEPEIIDRIDDLHDRFDLFLFDQYGVLHNGRDTYNGMVDCVMRLKGKGNAVGIISNSGKRADYNAERLSRFGFGPTLVDKVISSGEVAYGILRTHIAVMSKDHQGDLTVLYEGRGQDRSAIKGLGISETDNASQCDFVLIAGSEPERYSLDDYEQRLQAAAKRNVPAFCTNPDQWSLNGASKEFGPGRVAQCYESLGGQVTWIGKPHADIYHYALGQFGVSADRVLCIGDSLEHDIAGARAAGCASVLTASGILADLGMDELTDRYRQYQAVPDFLIRREH